MRISFARGIVNLTAGRSLDAKALDFRIHSDLHIGGLRTAADTVNLNLPGIESKPELPKGSTDAYANGEQASDIATLPKDKLADSAETVPSDQGRRIYRVGTTKSGINYTVNKEGTGEGIKTGQKAVVHYVGYLPDGKKFDSSRDRGQPYEFVLGGDRVIKGWNHVVAGMKEGEIRKSEIPAEFGYGAKGKGPIPPNSPMVFEIELIAIR